MGSNATSVLSGLLDRLQQLLPASSRETLYRIVAGVVMFLTGYGVIDGHQGALWSQLAVATITCLFALLYSTSDARAALYLVVGPLGAVLMAYGLISDTSWAVIVSSVGQILGVTTAAAKAVEVENLTPVAPPVRSEPPEEVVAVSTPREATTVRRRRRTGATT